MTRRNLYVKGMALLLWILVGTLFLFHLSCSKEKGVKVLTPKANEVIERESEYEILWKIEVPGTEFGALVVIEFSKDGGRSWEKVGENVPNLGVYKWKVPKADSTNCRIRLTSQLNPKYSGSSGIFTVR